MVNNDVGQLAVVILAAGKGKRMNCPDMAKVMFTLQGKPLIGHVLEQASLLKPTKLIVVVGHQKQSVIDYISSHFSSRIETVEQKEQLGTGHAVAQTEQKLSNYDGDVLILAGDVPLMKASTLKKFIEEHKKSSAAISDLTTIAPNPKGYGRIVRGSDGSFQKIVEEKDADDIIRKIKEINSGVFIVNSLLLFHALKEVKNNNAQAEYYLTDVVDILRKNNAKVIAFAGADFDELQGVNSPEDLKRAEEIYFQVNKIPATPE